MINWLKNEKYTTWVIQPAPSSIASFLLYIFLSILLCTLAASKSPAKSKMSTSPIWLRGSTSFKSRCPLCAPAPGRPFSPKPKHLHPAFVSSGLSQAKSILAMVSNSCATFWRCKVIRPRHSISMRSMRLGQRGIMTLVLGKVKLRGRCWNC